MRPSQFFRLSQTIEALQRRFGRNAVHKLTLDPAIPVLPTGYPELDRALHIGGVPRGRIAEFSGVPTSGVITLALKLITTAQAQGEHAAYIDYEHLFDADYAARCGVHLPDLLLVRPDSGKAALAITHSLVTRGGISVLVFDSVPALLVRHPDEALLELALRRLVGALAQSRAVVIFLNEPVASPGWRHPAVAPDTALPHYAALRLLIERGTWLRRWGDVIGYTTHVSVVKHKLAPPGARVTLRITFGDDGQAEEDGL